MKNNLDVTKPRYSEHVLPVHCSTCRASGFTNYALRQFSTRSSGLSDAHNSRLLSERDL